MRRQSGSASYHYSAAIPSTPRVGGYKGNIRAPAKSLFTGMHLMRWRDTYDYIINFNLAMAFEFILQALVIITLCPEEILISRRSSA